MKRTIIFSLYLTLFLNVCSHNSINTGDFGNQSGIQVYYESSTNAYFYSSFTGSGTSINGKLYLILNETKENINKTGYWIGVGFGSSTMSNSDMVLCMYIPEKEFYCEDSYSNAHNRPSSDQSLGAKNNIVSSSGSLVEVFTEGYKTMLSFSFTKDISNLDDYDWKDFSQWQTSKKGHSGAYGLMSGRQQSYHKFRQESSLIDGQGFSKSLKIHTEKDEMKTLIDENKSNPNETQSLPKPDATQSSKIINIQVFILISVIYIIIFA